MQLANVLAPDRIAIDTAASSKKTLLEKASELLAAGGGTSVSRAIFESLCQRERLGSTGLGHGVAIPHGRVEGQADVVGALIRLQKPIQFDAPDNEPVDLFFALVVPQECTDTHLRLLAEVAEAFSNDQRRRAIREAGDSKAVLEALTEPAGD